MRGNCPTRPLWEGLPRIDGRCLLTANFGRCGHRRTEIGHPGTEWLRSDSDRRELPNTTTLGGPSPNRWTMPPDRQLWSLRPSTDGNRTSRYRMASLGFELCTLPTL